METKNIFKIIFISICIIFIMSFDYVNAEENIILNKEVKDNNVITITWKPIENVSYYKLYKYNSLGNIIGYITLSSNKTGYEYSNLENGMTYKFKLEAYDEMDNLIAYSNDEEYLTTLKVAFNEKNYRVLKNNTIKNPRNLGVNLRTKLKEKYKGYSIVQGAATDGVYSYYLMIKRNSNYGRILKLRIRDNAVIKRSSKIKVYHGNGMTYDYKNNRLVINGKKSDKTTKLTLVDASSLKLIKRKNINYDNYSASSGWKVKTKKGKYYGINAITYIKKYDLYVGLQRSKNNLLVLDQNFKVIGYIKTNIKSTYPGLYQGMAGDEKYIYLLLSPYNKNQPNNMVLALDWNSEKLLGVLNSDLEYVKDAWTINNSGREDAKIIVKTPHEAENIYFTPNNNSTNHFYLSEYHYRPVYKTVKKKKAYKVKVIKHGKVTYKKKYKKVKKKVLSHYSKEGYVYDLGSI